MPFHDPYYVELRKEIFSDVDAESHWDKLK